MVFELGEIISVEQLMLLIHYSNENRMGGILSSMYRTVLDFEGER